MIIAIDGPAGSGKSTVASLVGQHLRFEHLNSGSFYRAITWQVLDLGINPQNEYAIARFVSALDLEIEGSQVIVDGENPGSGIYSDEINVWVSMISTYPEVREAVNDKLRIIADAKDLIIEGRDITTVVFPRAEFKFYLDATIESRALRKYKEGNSLLDLSEIKKSIIARDTVDRSKAVGKLEIAPDAVYLDTSDLTVEEVCEKVLTIVRKKGSAEKGDKGIAE